MSELNGYDELARKYSYFNVKADLCFNQINTSKDALSDSTALSAVQGLANFYKKMPSFAEQLPHWGIDEHVWKPLELTHAANLAISDLVNSENVNRIIRSDLYDKTEWMPQLFPAGGCLLQGDEYPKGLGVINSMDPSLLELSVQSNFSKISGLSILSEAALSNISLNELGRSINISEKIRYEINDSFSEMASSYSNFFNAVKLDPQEMFYVGPGIARLTSVEYFNAVDLCEVVTVDEPLSIEKELIRNDVLIENEIGLKKYLPTINPDFIGLWEGATEALNSDNPDKVRHFSVSVRELFTHVLHELAPDEEVRKWSTSEDDYDKGKPTRKARLLYICRYINNGAFKKFVSDDVKTTTEFIDLFQKGTHALEPKFSHKQLVALKARAEATIKYIIEIAR